MESNEFFFIDRIVENLDTDECELTLKVKKILLSSNKLRFLEENPDEQVSYINYGMQFDIKDKERYDLLGSIYDCTKVGVEESQISSIKIFYNREVKDKEIVLLWWEFVTSGISSEGKMVVAKEDEAPMVNFKVLKLPWTAVQDYISF